MRRNIGGPSTHRHKWRQGILLSFYTANSSLAKALRHRKHPAYPCVRWRAAFEASPGNSAERLNSDAARGSNQIYTRPNWRTGCSRTSHHLQEPDTRAAWTKGNRLGTPARNQEKRCGQDPTSTEQASRAPKAGNRSTKNTARAHPAPEFDIICRFDCVAPN